MNSMAQKSKSKIIKSRSLMVLLTNALQKKFTPPPFFSFGPPSPPNKFRASELMGKKRGRKGKTQKMVKKLFNTILIVFFLLAAVRTASPGTGTGATAPNTYNEWPSET